MIFIYGEVFSLMSERPRKNQGERDRNVIKTLKINSCYMVLWCRRRKTCNSGIVVKYVIFLHAKPVYLHLITILPFLLILHDEIDYAISQFHPHLTLQ